MIEDGLTKIVEDERNTKAFIEALPSLGLEWKEDVRNFNKPEVDVMYLGWLLGRELINDEHIKALQQ